MNWRDYEKQVLEYFQVYYPGSQILFDQKILGKFSKVERQIHILIESDVTDKTQRIIVDCKFYSKKINVKHVESFSSMVEDVEGDQGILITNLGYSKAAISRAHYGKLNIELDIINIDSIKKFQGYLAMPYVGHFSIFLLAPFGWILDLENPINNFSVLHQRGITLSEAQVQGEWMYVNFWLKKEKIFSIEDLIKVQNEFMEEDLTVRFRYLSGVKRSDEAQTKIRIANVESYSSLEVTGYIEFEETIFFIVLFTPKESLEKNLRKLRYMLTLSDIARIEFDNSKVIEQLLVEATKEDDLETRATMFYRIANWYKEMRNIEHAIYYFKKSIETFPSHYSSLKQVIFELVILGQYEEAEFYAEKFHNTAPTNPRVCHDLIDIYMKNNKPDLLKSFFQNLLDKTKEKEILGNISFHQGQLALFVTKEKDAAKYFQISKDHFETILPKNHQVFKTLDEYLKRLK